MDNKENRPPQNEMRININEKNAVDYWTRTLGVTKRDLEKAIKAVGVGVEEVKAFLKDK